MPTKAIKFGKVVIEKIRKLQKLSRVSEPPTRPTLLLRIRNSEDKAAWEEFVEIYTPLIHNFALKRGLQSADARDVLQVVLRNIFRAIQNFEYDQKKGTFRSWLYIITRREISLLLRKAQRRPFLSPPDELESFIVDNSPRPDWDLDYKLRLLQWACEKIKPEFSPRTWQSFHRTAILEENPMEVANALNLSRAAVYMARSRILARLREKVSEISDASWELDAKKDTIRSPDR